MTCYQRLRRTGQMARGARPYITTCRNCGIVRTAGAKGWARGQCRRCYHYQWVNGVPRPYGPTPVDLSAHMRERWARARRADHAE